MQMSRCFHPFPNQKQKLGNCLKKTGGCGAAWEKPGGRKWEGRSCPGERDSTAIPPPSMTVPTPQSLFTISSSLAAHHLCCMIPVGCNYSPLPLLLTHCKKFLLINQSLERKDKAKKHFGTSPLEEAWGSIFCSRRQHWEFQQRQGGSV